MPELDLAKRDRDEWISAYLDGVLDQADLAAFEQALESDPALAADLARLLDNDALLRGAFDGPMRDDVDAALLARMGLAEPAGEPAALPVAANDNPPFWRGWRLPAAGAIAACLALALTLGMPGGPAPMQFGPALDATASGQLAALDNGTQLTPVLSFAAADGRFCREFSLTGAGSGGKGIACREGPGTWRVEALEPGATRLADSAGIGLAAGADSAALADAYDRLKAGDPLPMDRERDLIAHDWQAGR